MTETIKQKEEEFDPKKFNLKEIRFSFDLKDAVFEIDALQNELLHDYLRLDPRFRRAFSRNFTNKFIEFMQSKIKLKEPYHIAVMGTIRGGKTTSEDSKILMANGDWKVIKDVKLGEIVLSMDKDGKVSYSKITNINKYYSKDVYDVFEKNRGKEKLYTCTGNHLIPVYHYSRKRISKDRKAPRPFVWDIKEFTAKELSEKSDMMMKANYLGMTSFPIEKYQNRENCEIEPYVFGIYLGDGNFNKNQLSISNSNPQILEEISKHYKIMNIQIKKGKTIKEIKHIYYSINNGFAELLRKYGLQFKKSSDKFIPKDALLSDINYRKRLLAGLIDTDGYIKKNGSISISTKSQQLARDISDLVFSIGGRAKITQIEKKIKKINFKDKYYNISIYLQCELPLINKFKIKRINGKYAFNSPNRTAIKVVKAKPCKVVGIEIDSPSRWFLINDWNITHNSYSAITICCVHMAMLGKVFTPDYICANQMEFIERIKDMPKEDVKDSIFLIDEEKSMVGVGSTSRKMRLIDINSIIARENISTININPVGWSGGDNIFYGMRVFGRDFRHKLCRFMLYNLQEKGSGGSLPLGNIYIPIFTSVLPKPYADWLEKAYINKKDEWIQKEYRSGEGDVLSVLRKKSAQNFLRDPKFMILKKKNEKISYITYRLGSSWSKGEIMDVYELTKLLEQGVIEDDNVDNQERNSSEQKEESDSDEDSDE